ncbi:hypothetical protein J6590_046118 [Homalodisca vitripennis]|nr:hypothetical protein J6590_046118 [Homalodisca vitripennis]
MRASRVMFDLEKPEVGRFETSEVEISISDTSGPGPVPIYSHGKWVVIVVRIPDDGRPKSSNLERSNIIDTTQDDHVVIVVRIPDDGCPKSSNLERSNIIDTTQDDHVVIVVRIPDDGRPKSSNLERSNIIDTTQDDHVVIVVRIPDDGRPKSSNLERRNGVNFLSMLKTELKEAWIQRDLHMRLMQLVGCPKFLALGKLSMRSETSGRPADQLKVSDKCPVELAASSAECNVTRSFGEKEGFYHYNISFSFLLHSWYRCNDASSVAQELLGPDEDYCQSNLNCKRNNDPRVIAWRAFTAEMQYGTTRNPINERKLCVREAAWNMEMRARCARLELSSVLHKHNRTFLPTIRDRGGIPKTRHSYDAIESWQGETEAFNRRDDLRSRYDTGESRLKKAR